MDIHTRIGMCAIAKRLSGLSLGLVVKHIDHWFIERHEDKGYLIKHDDFIRLQHICEWACVAHSAYVREEVELNLMDIVVDVNNTMWELAACPNCGAESDDYPYIWMHREEKGGDLTFTMSY